MAVAPVMLGWFALLLAGAALPVAATAAWLAGERVAMREALESGVWILKAALAALAVAGAATAQLARRWRGKAVKRPPARVATGDGGRGTLVTLGALLLLAAVLRVIALESELWYDEIGTLVRYVPLSVTQIVTTYDSQNNHLFYSLLARIASLASGGAEWAIRIPAVVFGVASLWAVFTFARRVASRAEALVAVLLLAVSYHHVWFSQNARGYTAILFFTLVTTTLFLRLADEGEERPGRLAWAYGAMMGLASYTHLTATLVAVGHALALAVVVPPWRWRTAARTLVWPGLGLVIAALITVTLYALVLPQLLDQLQAPASSGGSATWKSGQWLASEMLRVLASGVPGGVLSVALGLTFLVVGAFSYWRQAPLIATAMTLPVALTAAVLVALRHNLWPRFFFFAAGFIALLALRGGFVLARAILRERGNPIAVAGAVAVAALSALTVPRAWHPKQQFDAAAAYVQAAREPGDAVVAVDMAAYVYENRRPPPGWHFTNEREALAGIERSSRRTWVVYSFPTHLRGTYPELAEHITVAPYREIRVFPATIGDGEIRVLRTDNPAPDD